MLGVMLLTMCLLTASIKAQKPDANSKMELVPQETEQTIRYQDRRVSKESGAVIAMYRADYQVDVASPEAMARQYLRENNTLFKMRSDLQDLQHTRTMETPGGLRVRFRQELHGYPLYGSDIVVSLNHSNTVVFVMNGYKPLAALNETTPKISMASARQLAEEYLDISGGFSYDKESTEVYYADGVTRLAHVITLVPAMEKYGDWEVLVDAHTGDIFRVEDKALYGGPTHKSSSQVDGIGWVFDPDPLTRARAAYQAGGQFGDNNDADSDSLTANTVERTLRDIEFDGSTYYLRGPYAEILDFEAPFNGIYSQNNSSWQYTRSADDFEAVNVYFHIDQSMRYINETLGFTLMPYQYTTGVQSDPHGLSGQDNSHYISSTGRVAWGEGGVDDAEDLDVILHELGHGLHDWLTNGGLSQVNGLSEGSGDYWATSYNRSTGFWTPADPAYNWMFHWDGHNEFWAGRVTNYAASYPGGLTGSIHTDGQMWASTLMSIYDDIGRTATDLNFLEALSMTNSGTNQEDAAQAFIQADINNYGGANLTAIEQHFTARGYNVAIPSPVITHTPLTDTEDLNGPYTVSATITTGVGLATVELIYGIDGAFTDTLDMVDNNGVYQADIAGTGVATDYNYYILAVDVGALASSSPAGAPANFHAFSSGADTEPPVITHTPLGDKSLLAWPASLSADVSDNLGVASVIAEYRVNDGSATAGTFDLLDDGSGTYSADFPIDTSALAIGDSIFYNITANDNATIPNSVIVPVSGDYGFAIVDSRGVILVLDDDPTSGKTFETTDKGTFQRSLSSHPFGKSAQTMLDHLNLIGFTATMEDAATSDPATWTSYDLVISSSGFNVNPVASATYRAALENYVANTDNKLLIEGGEVGYDAASSPSYPTFATNVLHTDDWDADNAGDLAVVSSQASHPVVSEPNTLPSFIAFDYDDWASQDAMNTISGAYVVIENQNNVGTAGVSIFDDNSNPASAQIIYFAFNYDDVSDPAIAGDLLENAVDYLLKPEGQTNVAPSDFSLLTPADDDTVGGITDISFGWSAATDANGDPLTYTLTISNGGVAIFSEANIADTIYNYTGSDLLPDNSYDWDVTVSDGVFSTNSTGAFVFHTPILTGVNGNPSIPQAYALRQNYPNPFNPTTRIDYDLKANSQVKLQVFNLLGEEVRTLINQQQAAGNHTAQWDGRDNAGRSLASGIYLYRLEAGEFVATKKLILLK